MSNRSAEDCAEPCHGQCALHRAAVHHQYMVQVPQQTNQSGCHCWNSCTPSRVSGIFRVIRLSPFFNSRITHTHTHTCTRIHTYVHVYTHTYTHMCNHASFPLNFLYTAQGNYLTYILSPNIGLFWALGISYKYNYIICGL